jgi:hypothetical protein
MLSKSDYNILFDYIYVFDLKNFVFVFGIIKFESLIDINIRCIDIFLSKVCKSISLINSIQIIFLAICINENISKALFIWSKSIFEAFIKLFILIWKTFFKAIFDENSITTKKLLISDSVLFYIKNSESNIQMIFFIKIIFIIFQAKIFIFDAWF